MEKFRHGSAGALSRRPFKNRREAGRALAAELRGYAGRDDTLILALPRGGVPIGYEVARRLRAPLDVFLVRKLGLPGHEELAMGAIATGGVRILNPGVVRALGVPPEVIEQVAAAEGEELERRARLYRDGRLAPEMRGRTVILVDDGLATGASMRAAIQALRQLSPRTIIAAVPVASEEICSLLREEVDEMVCLVTPEPFFAVGLWYEDFSATSDEEVRDLLRRAAAAMEGGREPGAGALEAE